MLLPIIIIVLIIIFLSLLFSFVPIGLLISASASGVKLNISTLVGMRLRKVIPARIVNPLIKATKASSRPPRPASSSPSTSWRPTTWRAATWIGS